MEIHFSLSCKFRVTSEGITGVLVFSAFIKRLRFNIDPEIWGYAFIDLDHIKNLVH